MLPALLKTGFAANGDAEVSDGCTFVIDTDLQGEALREANIKEPLEEPSGFALALRNWPQPFSDGHLLRTHGWIARRARHWRLRG
jgi:hypothetical protein